MSLRWMPRKGKKEDVCKSAFLNDRRAIKHIPYNLRYVINDQFSDEKLIEIIKKDYDYVYYISKDRVTIDMWLAADMLSVIGYMNAEIWDKIMSTECKYDFSIEI